MFTSFCGNPGLHHTTDNSSPGFCSIRATTMVATSPVDSGWTRETTRLCRLSSCHPLFISLFQLIVTSPFVVLSLRHPLLVLSRQLVASLHLAVLSLRHPLVLSSSRCASLLSHHLSLSSRCAAHSSSCHAGWLLSCHLVLPPLIFLWRQLVVTPSSLVFLSLHRLLSFHCSGWLLRCLSLYHPLVVASPLVVLSL